MKLNELLIIFPDFVESSLTRKEEKVLCELKNVKSSENISIFGEGLTIDECMSQITEKISSKEIIINGNTIQLPSVTFY